MKGHLGTNKKKFGAYLKNWMSNQEGIRYEQINCQKYNYHEKINYTKCEETLEEENPKLLYVEKDQLSKLKIDEQMVHKNQKWNIELQSGKDNVVLFVAYKLNFYILQQIKNC